MQGLKITFVSSYLRIPEAAGKVKILIFLLKIKFFPIMPIFFVMQGKCLFSNISRPAYVFKTFVLSIFEWPLKTGFTVSGCTLTIRRSIRMFIFLKGSKYCTRAGTHSLLELRSKDCEVIWMDEALNIMAN